MRKILLLVVLFSLLYPRLSFSSARQDAIDVTLNQVEFALAQNNLAQDEYGKVNSASGSQTTYIQERTPDKWEREQEEDKNIFYISGGYETNYMRYREFSNKNTLDRDYGAMDGFYVTAGFKSNHDIESIQGRPFAEFYFRRFEDLITYDGRTWGGTAVKFNERSCVQQFGLKLGAYKDFAERGEITVYFNIGRRVWYRGENEILDGVITYAEKYYWTCLGPGARITYWLTPKFLPGLELEGLFTDSAKMRADLLEGATFTLTDVYGIEVKAPLKYYLFKNLSFDLTPYYTYWRIYLSEPAQISGIGVAEPDSKTHILGLQTGLTYYF